VLRSSLRWQHGEQARPTTWLELFALYRLMGGGARSIDPHEPRPLLKTSIKAFIKASKAMIKATGRDNTYQALRAHKGKMFVLAHYGILMHLPAVAAEVCIEEGVNRTLHAMLLSLRAVKQGPDKGKLKAFAGALPRVEPWMHIIQNRPQPIINILEARLTRQLDAIQDVGEGGYNIDLKPQFFNLSCPHCGISRDCAKVRLYAFAARGVTCSRCKRCTTSTRWRCNHGVPWTSCPIHREAGFRCGPQGLPRPLKALAP